MREQDDLIYLSAGALAALLLGMILVPIREMTPAANFSFPFMALTIAIAEFGGKRAAVVTALASALSLDFFLTRPYLALSIEGKHDVIAFVGLTACGLIAAAFGSTRRRRAAAPEYLDLLRELLRLQETAGPIGPPLEELLEAAQIVLPLNAIVVRNAEGDVVAASRGGRALAIPTRVLSSLDALCSPELPFPRRGSRIDTDGVRVPLAVGNEELGWLDLWGNGRPANVEVLRTLADLGRVLRALASSGAVGFTIAR